MVRETVKYTRLAEGYLKDICPTAGRLYNYPVGNTDTTNSRRLNIDKVTATAKWKGLRAYSLICGRPDCDSQRPDVRAKLYTFYKPHPHRFP